MTINFNRVNIGNWIAAREHGSLPGIYQVVDRTPQGVTVYLNAEDFPAIDAPARTKQVRFSHIIKVYTTRTETLIDNRKIKDLRRELIGRANEIFGLEPAK